MEPQIYYTHDNGGRPFKVILEEALVKVQKLEQDNYEAYKEYQPEKVFIGKSPENPMTISSGGYGPGFDGNSFLLQQEPLKYLFIGSVLLTFTTVSKIVSFVSPVGNNDVPYPYAVDEEGRIYLLIEGATVVDVPPEYQSNPYDFYYRASYLTTEMGIIPSREPYFGPFEDISMFYLDDEPYNFCYSPFPLRTFQSYVEDNYTPKLKKQGGEEVILPEELYCGIMERYGEMAGFAPFTLTLVE